MTVPNYMTPKILHFEDVRIALIKKSDLSHVPDDKLSTIPLSNEDRQRLSTLSPIRKKEFLIARNLAFGLLSSMSIDDTRLYPGSFPSTLVVHTPTCPEHAISISHDRNNVAVCTRLDGDIVGIDIQDFRKTNDKLLVKICGEVEARRLSALSQNQVVSLFSAKEAIYKFFSNAGEQISQWRNIECLELEAERATFLVHLSGSISEPVLCKFFNWEGSIVSYV